MVFCCSIPNVLRPGYIKKNHPKLRKRAKDNCEPFQDHTKLVALQQDDFVPLRCLAYLKTHLIVTIRRGDANSIKAKEAAEDHTMHRAAPSNGVILA
jgi:hypothetical protein